MSLTLRRGEVLGVIGPNGAGKSTLVGLIGGAIKPDSGKIHFDGRDVSSLNASQRARLGIGRTCQIPRPFLHMTVRENLLAARYSRHPFSPKKTAEGVCDRLLDRTGLLDAADTRARHLPLLRRKRLELARALALDPVLLLLDEVGAGLVDSEISELVTLIRSLRVDVQGIVIIEHVLRVVRETCERLIVMNFGKPFAEGPTSTVLASDEVATIYLGTARIRSAPIGIAAPTRVDVAAVKPSRAPHPVDPIPLLELAGVHAGYGQARVLNGIDMKIYQGEVLAILGTNGAGKTTLANVICGGLRPSEGTIRINGQLVTPTSPHQIARLGVAHCMEGRRIFGSLTVQENLMLAARGVGRAEMSSRLKHVYDIFPDLRERRANFGTALSGGQQQMLAIGRAVMARPRVIIFDEISLGLSPLTMDRLYQTLGELKHTGMTMFIVEQDVQRVIDLADRTYVMERGRFALSGPAMVVKDSPLLRRLYIAAD
ncbi:ATP-binding cassette domain-containing protein [Trinickia sp. LjRoot230]|uniref:ATP-binding cassette domain-containing protein n=1 Tax=Trinickia sp. LjRoot230 TaxID=3342288 RepID=UPI003F4FE255